MAKFSAGRCFSVLPGYRYHLAGYSHVISSVDPDDKKGRNAAKARESGEQITLAR
jgi:hypothetical protein